jgi:hypothetical protein
MFPLKMLPPIDFDDEPRSVANKIDDVRPNRSLSPKTRAIHSMGAQGSPNDSLNISGILSQFSRARVQVGIEVPLEIFLRKLEEPDSRTGPLPTLPRKRGRESARFIHGLRPPASVGRSSGRKP